MDYKKVLAYVNSQISKVNTTLANKVNIGEATEVDLSNYYNKSQVGALIPEVPVDISELTDTEGLLNQSSGGLTKAQALGISLL